MSSETQAVTPTPTPKWMLVLGWVISLLPGLSLIASSVGQFIKLPEVVKTFQQLGWHEDLAPGVGLLKLACGLAFLIPRTAVFGAILCTGYLGGAIATHVRIGNPFVPDVLAPLMFGVLIWLGLLLRDEHVRAVLPLRSPAGGSSWVVRILFVLVILLVGFVAVIALQPAEFHVERSITIDAPAADIFPYVNDFHKWNAWSPWLNIDPNAKEFYEGEEKGKGAIFRWEGNDEVGAGSMTIIESRPSDLIKIKLEFIKPFEGTSITEFDFKQDESNKTRVTWSMSGQNNLIGKVFHVYINMDKMIGEKYDEGLANLKKVAEAKK